MPNSSTLLTLLALPALLLSLLLRLSTMPSPKPELLPGDTLIPAAEMLYTHSVAIHANPHTIFPWILQLGKGRGGWYLPRSWERVLPRSTHATRNLNREWTRLEVGDIVADYGFGGEKGEEDVFEVVEIIHPTQSPPSTSEGEVGDDGNGVDAALVYKSERYGTVFTWALVVRSDREEGREGWSQVTLRFRGRIQRTGWQRTMLVWGGGWMDWATTWPMLRGLRERCEEMERAR